MKIIDAHHHPDWGGHDLSRILTNMDQYGISRAWLFNCEIPEHEYLPYYNEVTSAKLFSSTNGPIQFERCVSYMERAPERFILGYAPDLRLPDACARLKAANSIYGAKVCGEVKCRTMYDNPDAIRLFRLAGELGMPVTVHLQYDRQPTCNEAWGEWFGGTIEAFERAVQSCPETIFLGHAPGFWIHISDDELAKNEDYPTPNARVTGTGKIVEMFRKYPNLYGDMSAGSGRVALTRDPDFAVKFITEFQDRLLYARDCFDNFLQDFLNGLNLPDEIMAKIYYKNAEKIIQA
jgi:predicted TIM-barrel fold metal-dependent hydrolase